MLGRMMGMFTGKPQEGLETTTAVKGIERQ
jgi:hypothetical protein